MKSRYLASCAAFALIGGWGGAAMAAAPADTAVATADAPVAPIEEVIVTAQRRTENVQSVPATIQAFTGATLDKLNIDTLQDLLKITPNVTYGSNGPGQGTIFMRGLSAGAAGNQSSATVGNFPNVAIYLDEQSMQFPGRNVDIYVADMSRIEVLEGPQGTLFGGGAEAGALRYITNKPKLNVTEGSVEGGYGFTDHGGDNTSLVAVLNVPLIEDKLAVRGVIYDDRQGGYITNVASTFTRSNADNNSYFGIKPTGGLCPNGLPAGSQTGYCTPLGTTQANNYALAGKDSNPVTHQGFRISALYKINNDWDVLIAESLQNLDAEGPSTELPVGSDFQPLQPLETTFFSPIYDHDHFENTAWTVNGKVGDFKVIYTGAYTDRHINQQMDYTNYSRTLYGQYYECTGGGHGLLGSGPIRCYSPVTSWHDKVENTHLSNEFRISTPDTWRLRGLAGAYIEEFRIYDNMDFNYRTVPSCSEGSNLSVALAGGAPCFGNVETAPGSTANEPGVRGDTTGFGEDVQRGYDQYAGFGSLDFDIIPKVLTITAGTRYYDYEEFEKGSQYGTNSSCLNVLTCFHGIDIDDNHDKVSYSGFKSRFGVQWHPAQNIMLYYLYSEGFRPGGFSRGSRDKAPDANGVPQYHTPNGYSPDSLVNNEIGAKTELFDRRLLLNVSAYYMQWTNVQLALYQPCCLGNTTFLVNGPNYDIKGVEAQFTGRVFEGFVLTGSASYNDNTQTNSPCLVDNEPNSPNLGKCITEINGKPFVNPFGVKGGVSAFSPHLQANLRGRYDWTINSFNAFVQAGASYTGTEYNQPANYTPGDSPSENPVPDTTYLRYKQPCYSTVDAQFGFSKDRWTFQIVGSNLTNSHASTFTSSAQFIKSEVPLRPRVVGVKLSQSF
jgi:outer membrane receptor protein involved in Fe transport